MPRHLRRWTSKSRISTGDGSLDVVVAETGGVEVIYGKPLTIPPNTTPQTARNLGTVVHVVEPIQTIVPGHEDSYYTLTVPTEEAQGAGNEILDFSGGFQATSGAGLAMEVTDKAGNVLGSGERFQIEAPQGAVLTLHVYGVAGGTGAYTLDIDVLPQVVSVKAERSCPARGPRRVVPRPVSSSRCRATGSIPTPPRIPPITT